MTTTLENTLVAFVLVEEASKKLRKLHSLVEAIRLTAEGIDAGKNAPITEIAMIVSDELAEIDDTLANVKDNLDDAKEKLRG